MMRQLGAEAAAKATARKASGTKPAPVPASESTTTAQTPTPTSAKEPDALSPSETTEMAASKTPALLAAEGMSKTSTEKIEDNEASLTSPLAKDGSNTDETESKSTEEQVLELRRGSTQTKLPSRLSESTPVEKSNDVLPEEENMKQKPDTPDEEVTGKDTKLEAESVVVSKPPEDSLPDRTRGASITSVGSVSSSTSASNPVPERRRSHRGSSLEEADKEAIRKAEQAIRIQEEDESHSDKDATLETISEKVDKKGRGEDDDQEVEQEKEKILEKSQVGIGKDVGSDEAVDHKDDDDDDSDEEAEDDEESVSDSKPEKTDIEDVKRMDAKKEEAVQNAKVDLPTGKVADVEHEDTDSLEVRPQKTKAAEVDDASKSVGD